jgi:hypothetical protein
MQKQLWILIVIICIITGCMGALLGAVLILVPLRILPNTYSLVLSTLIFVAGLLLSIKNFLDLISIRIDISKVSGVFDSSILVLYRSFFHIGVTTIIMVIFLTNISSYFGD